MRAILKGMTGLSAMLALAAPMAAQAAPDAATLHDMACFIMMSKLSSMPPDKGGNAPPPEMLKLTAAYFGGKVASRYPNKNILVTINDNRTAVNAVLAKPDPNSCAKEVQTTMGPPPGAPAPAPKP